jgi:hypothetical protein
MKKHEGKNDLTTDPDEIAAASHRARLTERHPDEIAEAASHGAGRGLL